MTKFFIQQGSSSTVLSSARYGDSDGRRTAGAMSWLLSPTPDEKLCTLLVLFSYTCVELQCETLMICHMLSSLQTWIRPITFLCSFCTELKWQSPSISLQYSLCSVATESTGITWSHLLKREKKNKEKSAFYFVQPWKNQRPQNLHPSLPVKFFLQQAVP